MAALFLQPRSALLWNTYTGEKPWSNYTVKPAAADLSRSLGSASEIVQRSGPEANVANWHHAVDPFNRFGMVFFNSSGGPDWFSISGGPGRPSDIPRGLPESVAMIHSFSAAAPHDGQTIAGRWLSQGAFTYFGALNEPFVMSFRPPELVAALLADAVPLVAALRQGEEEPFGCPWRLVYLGDPLYRVRNEAVNSARPACTERVKESTNDRIPPAAWRKTAPDYENWSVTEITAHGGTSGESVQARVFDSDEDRLRWCRDASVRESAGLASGRDRVSADTRGFLAEGWRAVFLKIQRDTINPELRSVFDDLLIDLLENGGAIDELMGRLAQIPADQRGPRVWEALETAAMQRLARVAGDRDAAGGFLRALDLWDEVIRLNWPPSSHFPAHFSERVGTLALAEAHRSRLWLGRLRGADKAMAGESSRHPLSEGIAAERTRAKAKLGGLGSSR